MGTPISISHELDPFTYVRDGFPQSLPPRVPSSEITPSQWLELVKTKTETIKPHLKYLPGWRPLGEIVKDKSESTMLPPKYSRSGFSVRDNDLCQFVLTRRFLMPIREWAPSPTALLYIRRDGTWLQWDSLHVYEDNYYFEDRIVVKALNDQDLLKLLEFDQAQYRSALGYKMVDWLQKLIDKGIVERKQRLSEVEALRSRVGKPLFRVSIS